jgi:hypothetical protein
VAKISVLKGFQLVIDSLMRKLGKLPLWQKKSFWQKN